MSQIIVRLKDAKPGFVFYWKDMIHVVCNQDKLINNETKIWFTGTDVIICFCPLDNQFYSFRKFDRVDIQTRNMLDD